jgi:hypothetical protein
MSDRPGSVRTQDATRAGEPAAASSTQAIPTTGTQRAQKADKATGSGGSSGAGTPPATGASPATPAAPARGAAPATGATAAAGTAASGPAPAKTAQASRPSRPAKAAGRGPRRARLQLRNIDIWSAFKISLVLSIALFFIWMVAVGILYGVLSALGVFDTLNDLFGQLGSSSGDGGGSVITPGVVFGGAAVIGAINVVLMTALCTVGTFIYNLCSDLVGGLEVTLSERD